MKARGKKPSLIRVSISSWQGLYHKETPLVIQGTNFTIELLALQSRHLNGTHSISDIKLPW